MKKTSLQRQALPTVIFTAMVVMFFVLMPQTADAKKYVDPLSPAERAWLAEHPVIKVAPDPSSPPQDIFDSQGNWIGLSADYIHLIEKKLNIKFQVVHYKTWEDALSSVRERRADVLTSTLVSPERKAYLLFTESYSKAPVVIITRNDVKGELTLAQLRGKKVIVVAGYVWQGMLERDYPEIDLITVNNPATGLRILSFGGADAMVNDEAATSYFLSKENLTNLQVSGITPYDGTMCFAVRKDWPELQVIINKGLVMITAQEKQAIHDKWINLGNNRFILNERFLNIAKRSLEAAAAVFLLLVFGSWRQIRKSNRRLAEELAQRELVEQELTAKNQELQSAYNEINASCEQIESLSSELEQSYRDLIASNRELKSLKERLELALRAAEAGMWDWYIQTGELFFNERYAEIHGYASSELPQDIADWKSRVHPDEWEYVRDRLDDHVEGRTDFWEAEYRIRNKEGPWVWLHDSGRVVSWDDQGKPERALGIIQEITARKKDEAAALAEEKRLRSLLRISQQSFRNHRELLDCVLDEMVAFSESHLGYISFYSEEEELFRFYAWSEEAMAECAIDNPPMEYVLEQTGLWGETVRQRQTIIVNDYQDENIYKKGYPAGHVELQRFMTLPVFSEGRIVAVVGVGNKTEDYSDLDARELNLLIDSLWKLVEIKQAEQALIRSEENFSKIFYHNPVSMVIVSLQERRLLEINDVFEQRSGYRRALIIGQLFSEVGEWPYHSSLEQLFRDLEQKGSSRGRELVHQTPGGKEWLLKMAADVIEFDGQPAALIAIADITNRRKAEQAMISSMALYRGIFTATNNAALLLDIEQYRVLEANPAALRLFGYTLEDMRQLDFTSLNDTAPEPAAQVIKEDINEAWCNGSSTRRGLARRKDGGLLPVWIYLNIVPIEESYRVLVVINDLSDEIRFREEHEKALRYEAQAMKMTTVDGVVQELSQPLNAIKALAAEVMDQHETGLAIDPGVALDTLGQISRQAAMIDGIVRRMSSLAE